MCARSVPRGTITTIAGTGGGLLGGRRPGDLGAAVRPVWGCGGRAGERLHRRSPTTACARFGVRRNRSVDASPRRRRTGGWLYGADAASTLFRIDAASGATRRVGATGVRGITDIAFTPAGSSTDQLQPALPGWIPAPAARPPIGNGTRHGKRERARLGCAGQALCRLDHRRRSARCASARDARLP